MSEPGSSPPTLMEITAALVEAFVERRHGPFLAQEEAACPKCEGLVRARPSRSRTVETLLGPVTLERPYFYRVFLSVRVLSAGRGPGPVGAAQAVGRAAGRGQAGPGDAPPARLEPVGRAHRRVDERRCDSRGAATDRVVAGACRCVRRRPTSRIALRKPPPGASGGRSWFWPLMRPTCPVVPRPPKGLVRGARRAGLGEGVGRGNTTKPRAFAST